MKTKEFSLSHIQEMIQRIILYLNVVLDLSYPAPLIFSVWTGINFDFLDATQHLKAYTGNGNLLFMTPPSTRSGPRECRFEGFVRRVVLLILLSMYKVYMLSHAYVHLNSWTCGISKATRVASPWSQVTLLEKSNLNLVLYDFVSHKSNITEFNYVTFVGI
jgi:hypothetical protein